MFRGGFPLSNNSRLYLILAIHNHQPVGNFDYVLEESYKKAYLPFLELLQQHPSLKVVMHYSGNLLSWIAKKHPEAIKILRGFVKTRRIEFLSGGFYEPILSAIPEEDRIMQIREMTDYIAKLFDYSPRGMWLAERVWEPHMPRCLAEAGIEYLPLDDYHFKLSGIDDESLTGYFITEELGHSIKVFPGSERLRYYVPFRGVDETISHLREIYTLKSSGDFKDEAPLITMADDGEKFGVWPDTFKHCYENGWLERFFSALEENSGWLATTTFSEYQAEFYPKGTVYLPAASYREMGEWALPQQKGLEYEIMLNEMQSIYGENAKGMLRGGIWRSFLSKYPESNHIHKRMLMISAKVHKALKRCTMHDARCKTKHKNPKSRIQNPKSMLHELWKGQCNDAYWHGIFGGLYLPHLRSSLYRHLINAEAMAEDILSNGRAVNGRITWKHEGDLDNNGFRDICVSSKDITAFFTERGGSLIELSLKNKSLNILDTLTRRPEAYHAKLSEAGKVSPETKTIHDRLSAKEAGLSEHLVYDSYRRASLLDHFFEYGINIDSLIKSEYKEKGDFINGIYSISAFKKGSDIGVKLKREGVVSGAGLRIEKTVVFRDSGMSADYVLSGSYSGMFGIEFNISILGSPYASIEVGGKSLFVKDMAVHDNISEFLIKYDLANLWIRFSFDEEINLWHYPVETISLSEEGVERIYQGTSFIFTKRLDFTSHKRLGLNMQFVEVR